MNENDSSDCYYFCLHQYYYICSNWNLHHYQKTPEEKNLEKSRDDRFSVGIFHPFCAFGNAEERVLWGVISALQSKYPQFRYIVYTGDLDSPPERILSNAFLRLQLSIGFPVEFVYVRKRYLIDPNRYLSLPRLGINFGSIGLALEALWNFVPDVYLDTVGLPFTFPVFKYLGGCGVGSYLSMSPDVLYAFYSHRSYAQTSRNKYANLFHRIPRSKAYRACLTWAAQCGDVIVANSSWTQNYMRDLLGHPESTISTVYPPCPVEILQSLSREDSDMSSIQIISLTQFTPLADHPLQIRTLFQLRQLVVEEEWDRIRLLFVGTCNTSQESSRIKDMEDLCKHLSLEHNVIFRLNLPYEETMKELGQSLIAIHTQASDPFSIGLVECMAAGVLCVAHNSGGTSSDITKDYMGCRNAFLATDELEYAEAIKKIIHMRPEERALLRIQGQVCVERCSEKQFRYHFLEAIENLIN